MVHVELDRYELEVLIRLCPDTDTFSEGDIYYWDRLKKDLVNTKAYCESNIETEQKYGIMARPIEFDSDRLDYFIERLPNEFAGGRLQKAKYFYSQNCKVLYDGSLHDYDSPDNYISEYRDMQENI